MTPVKPWYREALDAAAANASTPARRKAFTLGAEAIDAIVAWSGDPENIYRRIALIDLAESAGDKLERPSPGADR